MLFPFIQRKKTTSHKSLESNSIDFWQLFADISLKRKYFEESDVYYRLPVFTPVLHAHAGKEITLTGYYLPFSESDSIIIISRYPNASCFFCGRAGIESVALVEVSETKSYRTDQVLSVKGRLELNSTDFNKLAFIIKDASVEEVLN
jgi:uncharacterized membrane protein YcgQ (UPF0703/DUF1980 family)